MADGTHELCLRGTYLEDALHSKMNIVMIGVIPRLNLEPDCDKLNVGCDGSAAIRRRIVVLRLSVEKTMKLTHASVGAVDLPVLPRTERNEVEERRA